MTTQAEAESRSHTSNKENSNLVSNIMMTSNNKSCVDSVHSLLLETLSLLQNAVHKNYPSTTTAPSRDLPSMSIQTVQKLIEFILETNLKGVHSIIIEASQNASMPHSREADEFGDEEEDVVKSLFESHIVDREKIPETLDDEGEIIEEIQQEGDIIWKTSKEENMDNMLLGPLNHKIGGTTGVVLELDNSNYDNGTTPTVTNSSSFSEEDKAAKYAAQRQSEYMVRILSSSGTFPDTSAHEAIANDTTAFSQAGDTDDEGGSELETSLYQLTADVAEEAVDVGSLPRQGYFMMRYLCEHLLLLHNDDRSPPPPPPSPSASSVSLSLKFSHARLPAVGKRSDQASDEERLGYTKWTFTKEEIEIIEQEYEWFVNFYSLNELGKQGDHRSIGESYVSEKLSGSNYTNMISVGDCNLSNDLEENLCLSDDCQRNKNSTSLLDNWIGGISDDEADEDKHGIEFFRLGVSHVDLLSRGSNDDDSEGECSNASFRYESITEAKEIFIDRNIKPQDSSRFCGQKYDDEVFVEFHLPVVYKPYKTGLEPSPKLELNEGDIVAGRYQVASELGSAAFSVAYHCIDMHESISNPNVCLKVIQNSKDFLDQSLDEIKVLQVLQNGRDGNLGHTSHILPSSNVCDLHHILHLRRYFYYKEHLILVTELLEDNLYEFDCKIRPQQNYFTLPRLCYITRQILVALQYVHSLGLIHSDVKPENIVMWSHQDAKVKLIDFGSACFTTDQLSSYVQSRSYRAPEVVLGLPYGSKIDLWSLGCVVAELFTGRVLFQNESIVEMLALIEAVCGVFPKDMIAKGRTSRDYYLASGLLCSENVIEENGTGVVLYDIYRPNRCNLEDWLGLHPPRNDEAERQFIDFLRKLLTVDPVNRPTAEEALAHPWILWGMLLTEDDVKYSPS